MTILYALVARGAIVLAEHATTKGNFTTVARRILEKLPSSGAGPVNQKMSYVYDRHLFHYQLDGDLVFLCMAEEEFGRTVPFAFLEDIKNRFRATYGNRASAAPPMGMNEDFSRVLKNQMDYFSNSRNVDKLSQVKGQIDEVKTVMVQNIENVLKRGERIELLVDRTENLESHALNFRQKAVTLKRAMWWKNVKLMAILACVVLFAIYFIVAIACGGLGLPRCVHKGDKSSNSTELASTHSFATRVTSLLTFYALSSESDSNSDSDSDSDTPLTISDNTPSSTTDNGEEDSISERPKESQEQKEQATSKNTEQRAAKQALRKLRLRSAA